MTNGIHRVVEQRASAHGAVPAIVDAGRVVSYHEMNAHANAAARHLLRRGFRRKAHALVVLEPGAELAVALLAVLKAGGSYSWIEPAPGAGHRRGIFIGAGSGDEHIPVNVPAILTQDGVSVANLPVVTRPSDVAIVLHADGGGQLRIPHDSLVAISESSVAPAAMVWDRDTAPFDLWLGLMSGATLFVRSALATPVAA